MARSNQKNNTVKKYNLRSEMKGAMKKGGRGVGNWGKAGEELTMQEANQMAHGNKVKIQA